MPSKELQTIRARDVAPTGVRLPPSLRDELMRQASINSRSLSQEITQRLLASLEEAAAPRAAKGPMSLVQTSEPAARYLPSTDAHRQLTALFDALTPDKQLALLTLLRR